MDYFTINKMNIFKKIIIHINIFSWKWSKCWMHLSKSLVFLYAIQIISELLNNDGNIVKEKKYNKKIIWNLIQKINNEQK